MPIEITMPRLSDTMEVGTLVKWRVDVGDSILAGDHLADVETDKATMELQAFDDGTVAKISVTEGQSVPVGQTILILAEEGESVSDMTTSSDVMAADDSAESSAAPPVSSPVLPSLPQTGDKLLISPLARKLAEQHGLDLQSVIGTGPGGRIIKSDVLAAVAESASTHLMDQPPLAGAGPGTVGGVSPHAKEISLNSMRMTIARRLAESKTRIPHFQVSITIDMDRLLEWRQAINDQLKAEGVKLSVNDFITRAVALACVQHPAVNSSWAEDKIVEYAAVHVGIAVALPVERGGGLVVPVIRDAANKTLRQINTETKALAAQACGSGLSSEQMADGTITISNLGMYEVDSFTAIINPPQAAILAVGRAILKPVVRDGQIVPGHQMTTTLSGDHRVIDGATAAQFLQSFRRGLEQPAALLV